MTETEAEVINRLRMAEKRSRLASMYQTESWLVYDDSTSACRRTYQMTGDRECTVTYDCGVAVRFGNLSGPVWVKLPELPDTHVCQKENSECSTP